MKTVSIRDARNRLTELAREVEAGETVVVTRNGKPVAVLVGIQDEEEIERLLMAYTPRLSAILDRSREQIRRGESMEHAEFRSDLCSQGEQTRNRRRPT